MIYITNKQTGMVEKCVQSDSVPILWVFPQQDRLWSLFPREMCHLQRNYHIFGQGCGPERQWYVPNLPHVFDNRKWSKKQHLHWAKGKNYFRVLKPCLYVNAFRSFFPPFKNGLKAFLWYCSHTALKRSKITLIRTVLKAKCEPGMRTRQKATSLSVSANAAQTNDKNNVE